MSSTTVGDEDDVQVRQAVQADLLAVLRIERASFPQPWPFSAFERYLGEPGFLVAVEAPGDSGGTESVVGYVVADLVPNHGQPLGHVKDIAVHPECRGRGVGRTLLDSALTALEGRGARSVKLEVRAGNDPALALYEEFGFEHLRTVPRYYDDGEDALIMVVGVGE
ncbi:ribosomal protein S18-alanine N-acetyltransferase [Halorussus salilacus]|uniref:ribosomal protein S18-alanine N-acetyltransferase n=1 Tax=Halorussus salilacus TaxID=2953750 RepID=UPI0020A134DF|nr:ribosomal protein S18-alanine N-acetyltransferase [Halorussus salilacus]USZ69556.1 ribosomal protein S18-alanine N-acetyltransferase [Halorussus salilacus]